MYSRLFDRCSHFNSTEKEGITQLSALMTKKKSSMYDPHIFAYSWSREIYDFNR